MGADETGADDKKGAGEVDETGVDDKKGADETAEVHVISDWEL